MLYGPFWSTEAGFETSLLVTNPAARQGAIHLGVYSHAGRLVAEESLDLETVDDQAAIDFHSLVEEPDWGWFSVRYSEGVEVLSAQTVVTKGANSWEIALEDGRRMGLPTAGYYAVAAQFDHEKRPSQVEVFLSNSSDRDLEGTVRLEAAEPFSRSWRLSAQESRSIRFTIPPNSNSGAGPLRISVGTEEDGSRLLATGWIEYGGGTAALPIHFHTTRTEPSGELAGFFLGSDSRLLLWNLSDQPARISLDAATSEDGTLGGQTQLEAGESGQFVLGDLLQLAEDTSGALRVILPEGQRVIGELVNSDGDLTVKALRDTITETSSGYSLPVYLQSGFNTTLRIYNPYEDKVSFNVFLSFGQDRWTHPMVELDAREYVEIDLAGLRDEAVPDQFERIIPRDAEMGQAVVLFKTPVKRKLVVNGFVRNLQTGPTVVFGCSACVNLGFISLTPNPIQGVAGNSKLVNVDAVYNNDVWANVSFASQYVSDNQTVAGATDYWPFIDLLSVGIANITATYSECKQVPVLPGEGSGCECSFILDITRQDTSAVAVSPPTATISSAQSVKDGDSAMFSVTTNTAPQSISWSFQAPSTAGNDPSVGFYPINQAQTTADGYWFALPNQECPNVTAVATYDIIATVTFSNGDVLTPQTTLAVDAVWDPAGQVDPTELRLTGGPALGVNPNGTWYVAGMGTLGRQIPTKQVFVPQSSQFFEKADAHETEHLNHFMTGNPLFGSVFQPADFFDQIKNFTDSTQQGLFAQIVAQQEIFEMQQDAILNAGLNDSEVLAFAVSDPIAPQFIYQNCGRYQ